MKQLPRATPLPFAALALFALSVVPVQAAELNPADTPVGSLEVMLASGADAEGGECTVDEDGLPPEDTEAAAGCATTAAAAGDPLCANGGTKCKNPGASCTRGNGGCGVCRTTTVNDLFGHRCTGCTCFPF